MSLDWKIDLCALGGLSEENIGKIKMTKAQTVGIKSLVNKR
jgi:DNA-binding Xre family transcriptional regulator